MSVSSPSGSAVALHNVAIDYGATRAVQPLDLSIEPGHLHVVLGTSGSGKTTLLRALAGFSPVATGRILLHGAVVDEAERAGAFVPPERRQVGVVFQDYALFPHLTSAANVAFGMPPGSTHRDACAWLERVGLGHCIDRRPAQLSGGEQQRVAVARALASQPRLLLLDEPFSNLDPDRRGELRTLTAAQLRASGVTAVLVTHSAEEALELADQVTVLHQGRHLQTAAPDALYHRPASLQAARALGDVNVVAGTWADTAFHTPWGNWEAIAPPSASGPHVALVRPEQLTLCATDAANAIPVTIVARRFRGSDVDLQIVPPNSPPDAPPWSVRARPWECPADGNGAVRLRSPVVVVAAG